MILSAPRIVDLHDQLTRQWHIDPTPPDPDLPNAPNGTTSGAVMAMIALQHHANFELWHIEDEARTPGASDATIANVKRRVDSTNQRRNNLAEELDQFLIAILAGRALPNPSAPLHSESPGLMIDRLSILALKIFHTREEIDRAITNPSAPSGHAERNQKRLTILETQRADLANCLEDLWQSTLAGTRRFKLYQQLKMYNDPTLNPAIYQKRPA